MSDSQPSDRKTIYTSIFSRKVSSCCIWDLYGKAGKYTVLAESVSTACMTGTSEVAALPSSRSPQGTVSYGRFPALHREFLSNLLGWLVPPTYLTFRIYACRTGRYCRRSFPGRALDRGFRPLYNIRHGLRNGNDLLIVRHMMHVLIIDGSWSMSLIINSESKQYVRLLVCDWNIVRMENDAHAGIGADTRPPSQPTGSLDPVSPNHQADAACSGKYWIIGQMQ